MNPYRPDFNPLTALALAAFLLPHPASRAVDSTADTEVAAIHRQYDDAWARHDAAALERLLAAGFTSIGPDGAIETRAVVIDNLRSGRLKFTVAESEDVQVRTYGTTAVVRGRWHGKGTFGSQPFDERSVYTTVYVKIDGHWMAVSDQLTEVGSPEAGSAGGTTAPTGAALRQSIEAAEAAYVKAFNAGDPAAMASLYTDDAQTFPGDAPIVTGRPAIERMWAGYMADGVRQEATTLDVIGQGDFATETGRCVLKSKDGVELEKGKYFVLWKWENGGWKVHRETWNRDTKP